MAKSKVSHIFGGKKSYRLGAALQGGGSYGSFTKGVLKALLENDIEFSSLSGTSAGAVNSALLGYGLNSGGPKRAIEVLDEFWNDIRSNGQTAKRLMGVFNPLSFAKSSYPNLSTSFQIMASLVPKGFVLNALTDTLKKHIKDWKTLQNGPVKVFVNATRVDPQTGERSEAVFTGEELNADTVSASGAVEELGAKTIDGVDYFDGAYWRNPRIEDLEKEDITDLLVVTIQKKPKDGIKAEHQDSLRAKHDKPGHEILGEEIHSHIEHIRENSPDVNLHVISMDVADEWDDSSRMNTDPRWLDELEAMGYEAGQKWVAEHAAKLGKSSSYIGPDAPVTKSQRKLRR